MGERRRLLSPLRPLPPIDGRRCRLPAGRCTVCQAGRPPSLLHDSLLQSARLAMVREAGPPGLLSAAVVLESLLWGGLTGCAV